MKGREAADYVSSARSVYLNSWPSAPRRAPTLETHMFLEDIRNQVIPYRSDRESTIAVKFEPEGRRARRLVVHIFEPNGWDPDEAAEGFVRECVAKLLMNELVPYEIERLRRPQAKRASLFTLRPIQPWSVERTGGGLIQRVPEEDRELGRLLGNRDTSEAIFLPDEDLVCFSLPDELRHELRTTLSYLDSIPEPALPPWLPEELLKGSDYRVSIDAEELKTRRLAAVGRATMNLGWDGRGTLQGAVNEYYLLVRQIRWQMFLARLRIAVLDTLNQSLAAILAPRGVAATVSTANLAGLDELDALESRLATGAASLGQGYSAISLWQFGRDVHATAAAATVNPSARVEPTGTEPADEGQLRSG